MMIGRRSAILSHLCHSNHNLTLVRTAIFEKYKHGPTKISNPTLDYKKILEEAIKGDFVKFVKNEARRIIKKPFRRVKKREAPELNTTQIFEDFDSDEAIARWKPWADSNSLSGYSSCSFTRSPAGHGLFKGILDTRIPDDGLTQNSGFCSIIGPTRPRDKLFQLENYWDWENYNVFETKIRGDGRKYKIVINTSTYHDDQRHYDVYAYPLYTRGGPHWQTIQIPFSKFVLASKGFIQDDQYALPELKIKFVSITIEDSVDGPFSLEIDYMGLRRQVVPFLEATAYESYNLAHIRLKPLMLDANPPGE